MDTNITEKQKKLLMMLFTGLIIACIITLGIQPLMSKIKANKKELKSVQKEMEDKQKVVQDNTIESNYEKLKAESKVTFDKNYKSFTANEKIEEILAQLGISLSAIQIMPYEPIDSMIYENNVVQPTTQEAYTNMQTVIATPQLQLFLVSKITIKVKVTDDKLKQLLNAVNNIQPEGPGAGQRERYCLQIPELTYTRTGDGTIQIPINMYGMEPPPIED